MGFIAGIVRRPLEREAIGHASTEYAFSTWNHADRDDLGTRTWARLSPSYDLREQSTARLEMNRLAFGAICVAAGFIGGVLLFPGARSANEPTVYHQLDLFSDAFERVRSDYVTPTDDHKLVAYAIEGMVSSLDPHSEYMDAKALAELQSTTRGEFGGLGIEVTMEAGLVKVISPIDGTPAAKAGLRSGDYIAAIDGVPVEGMHLEDASNKMRGPAGTNVTLTVVRSGEKKPFDVTLTRANVQVDNVSWHREGDIGY